MSYSGGIFEALNGKVYGNLSSDQTLVLAAGYGTTQSAWQYLIPLFAYYFNFKMVVFDFAFSPDVCPNMYDPKKYSNYSAYADDLVSVLDELKLEKVIYFGHSMAAMVGCIASVRRPQLFEHLLLLSPSPRYINDHNYVGGFTRNQIETLFKQMSQNYTSWAHSFAVQSIALNDRNAISFFENSLLRMDPDISLDAAKTVFLSDWRWILPKVFTPTTIIKSKIDPAVPQKVAYYMMEHLGGYTKLKILDTQGHFPQLSAYVSLFKTLQLVLK
ncbi:hypothetical protein RND81_14G057700 [Saponaria officinalis]|uniref:AB hydrolase-1 domain-containing protein n=1 Tax=Saponaria officinalis TaxID=3572 RepID=A0AAW1GJR4_SAPOF